MFLIMPILASTSELLRSTSMVVAGALLFWFIASIDIAACRILAEHGWNISVAAWIVGAFGAGLYFVSAWLLQKRAFILFPPLPLFGIRQQYHYLRRGSDSVESRPITPQYTPPRNDSSAN